ncbi:hypothetical protein [Aequorivita viscosa]|nr:hypothetical protein [Aequorivita viscosa]
MNKTLYIVVFLLIGIGAFAQIPKNEIDVNINVFPKEKPALSINSNALLAGEALLYKIAILNEANKESELSKIAYVSLRNQSDSVVFNHKLKLKNGSGYGDFFLPADLKTGVYNLIGYTNFSRNNTAEAIDEKTIYVVNTFMENRGVSKSADTVRVNAIDTKGVSSFTHGSNEQSIRIKTDKQSYGYREKVKLSLESPIKNKGNYVLSVRQVNPIEISNKVSMHSQQNSFKTFYLPELRGEVVTGVVLSKKNSTPVVNKEVSFTIPGKEFVFKLAKTDKYGRFFFSVLEDYNAEKSIIQIIGEKGDTENYELVLDDKNLILRNSKPSILKIDPNLKEWLQERSVQLQVENAYFEKKRDSVHPRKLHPTFFNDMGVLYRLDDFTRFSTVRETFVEIITLAAIRGSGVNTRFLVYNEYDPNKLGKFNDIPPLVLLDGMMIQDNEELLNYNARDIKSIRVVSKPYRYGPKLFSGIISIETIKGDFVLSEKNLIEKIALQPAVEEKQYFKPDYKEGSKLSRIPDYRVQLLWNPQVDLTSSEYTTAFYTSDVSGIFEILLEGYTNKGQFISTKSYFTVTEN